MRVQGPYGYPVCGKGTSRERREKKEGSTAIEPPYIIGALVTETGKGEIWAARGKKMGAGDPPGGRGAILPPGELREKDKRRKGCLGVVYNAKND